MARAASLFIKESAGIGGVSAAKPKRKCKFADSLLLFFVLFYFVPIQIRFFVSVNVRRLKLSDTPPGAVAAFPPPHIVVSVRGIGNKKQIRVLYFNEVSARYLILVSESVHP